MKRPLFILAFIVTACDADELTAVHPLWSPDRTSRDNPLPDDRLDAAEGGLILRPQALLPFTPESVHTPELVTFFDRYAAHAGAIDGWGAFASSYLRFSGPIDRDSLHPDVAGIVALDPDLPPVPPVDLVWHADPGFLEIAPRAPLASGARYALVVTNRVTARGLPLVRPPEFQETEIVSRVAAALHLDPEDIVLASPFHTQAATDETLALARWIDGFDPVADFSGGVFTPAEFRAAYPRQSIDLDAAGRVALGRFTAFDFRREGVIDQSLAGDPSALTQLDVALVEPRSDRFPPPWPIVIIQHGFNGSKEFVLDRSGEYTRRGFAVIGIDAAGHGSRGIALQFINLEDVRKLRDAFRQTALDLLQLERLAAGGTIDLDGVPGPDFQGRVQYFGHSFGAITGALFVALKPDDRVAVLNATGGAFREIFNAESLAAGVALLLRGAVGLDLDDPGYEEVRPVIYNLAQVIFEQADPVVYGKLARDRARILLQEGVGDRLVPNRATELLVTELGLPQRHETIEDARGLSGWWRVDPSAYGIPASQDPHGVYFLIEGVRDQAVEYLRSRGTHIVDP